MTKAELKSNHRRADYLEKVAIAFFTSSTLLLNNGLVLGWESGMYLVVVGSICAVFCVLAASSSRRKRERALDVEEHLEKTENRRRFRR